MGQGFNRSQVLKAHRQIDGLNWQFGGEKMHYNFLHRSEFLPHAVVNRAGAISVLESDLRQDISQFAVESMLGQMPLESYVQAAPVNGLIILQHGCIVYEVYPRMRPFDKHALMSVSKVLVASLLALLESRGLVEVQSPVECYLPEVRGSGWEGVPVLDVLDMASGIDAPEVAEGFVNPRHPYYQYEASLGWLPATSRTNKSTYRYVAGLKRKRPPGLAYEYTSVNTFVLAWLAETISGLPLHEILTREIWSQIGAEADALLSISTFGAPAAHGGVCATLRDVARFGLMFTPYGAKTTAEVIPPAYLQRIQSGGRPHIFDQGSNGASILHNLHGEHPSHNTYQWDYVMPDGDFFKSGYGGQGLYVSPQRELVIAYFGTPFDEGMQTHELQWITRQMLHAGLF